MLDSCLSRTFVAAMCLLAAAPVRAGTRLHVVADSVNMRSVADPEGEIVGQVARGETVTATGAEQAGWVEIEAPSACEAYVYGELVRDNVVAVNSVRIRSGPGIGYRPIGELSRGAAVIVRGRKGDWIQIAPTPGVRVWISGEYVSGRDVSAAAVARPPRPEPAVAASPPATNPAPAIAAARAVVPSRAEPPPVPPPTPVAVVPSAPVVNVPASPPKPRPLAAAPGGSTPERWVAPPTRPLAPLTTPAAPLLRPVVDTDEPPTIVRSTARVPQGLALVSQAPQGTPVQLSGTIRPAGLSILRPSGYRLVDRAQPGPVSTRCYVSGDTRALDAVVGERVLLRGRKYWVQCVREPIVVIDSLTPAGR